MGVKQKKTKIEKKDVSNGKEKPKNNKEKVKKKSIVSCLQCIKPVKDGGLEGKYRVAAPELMQDTFMSDSEDEGGEVECPIQQQQQYRYMNSEAGTLHRAKPLEDSVTDGHLWPSNNDKKVATMERQPVDIGFLVSFVVDARGGAMKAKRRGGVRVIVPPAACAAPTRVTCRAATRRAPAAAPPPLMEGEALASRLLELQPQGAKFLAPVIIEVPIFTSPCKEREIVILRSDTGETWQDHYLHNNDNPMIQEALSRERQEHGFTGEATGEAGERVARIVTCDFPHYLACVSRVRQEVHVIGPEGGTVSSAHIPQVQALFPAAALTKRIRVGLQAHGAGDVLARRILPRHAAVSPVITVEPRRRKFHRSITLTAPLPVAQGGTYDKQSTSNLRLLCSIMGGQARAVWEDVTGSTPLTITDDCASFTTTVSARFWLMNCQNVSDATKLATELYRDMLLVPFDVRIVVLGKRLDALEGRLLVMYITDRYAYETLLQQEHYTEVAHSTSVRFLDGKEVYLEFSGNLVPVTKSGSQPMFTFQSFKDNRVEFTVRVKHHEESPSGRVYFMNEPKVAKGEQSQTPTCVLDVELPERIVPRAGKSQVDYLNLDQSGFDALKDELSFHWGEHNNSHGPGSLPYIPELQTNGHHDKIITNGNVKYPSKDADLANITGIHDISDITDISITDINDTKPQVNGNTVHVDSNKTKATFDSDEDKTPMNTLEKGKKKEGGFLSGLTDKVKNVFGHSEDKDDESSTKSPKSPKSKESSPKSKESSPKPKETTNKSKESSPKPKESTPKPEPKPRESKEKSPPKPAPRIINEDLLGKVDDMFKDLKTKPHREDEDLESPLYKTKLIVDEDLPHEHDKDDLYNQYAMMQPVDTPGVVKISDPFQFYTGCCEGRFAKGQKHRHEETSTLLDRIEQEKFSAQEKLAEISDGINRDLTEDLDKLEKEKENLAQKTCAVAEDIIVKTDNIKGDIKNKAKVAKSGAQDKFNELNDFTNDTLNEFSESANKVHDNVNAKASEIQTNVVTGLEDVKSVGTELIDEKVGGVKDGVENKAQELDFLAREKAEELKYRGQDQIGKIESSVESTANNLKTKAKDGADAVADSVHNAQNNISQKAQELKSDAEKTTGKVKEAANEKLKDLGDSFESTKEDSKAAAKKAKKEAKKKAKEGKSFFTGLVSGIFGEKEKIESEVKDKIADSKESANDLLEQASAKKDELKNDVAKKQEELKEGANSMVQNVQNKTNEVSQVVSDTKNEIEKSAHDKAEEAKKLVANKTDEIKDAVHDKTNEAEKAIQKKKEEIKSTVTFAEDTVREKTAELKDAANNKVNEVNDAASELKDAASNKASEIHDAVSNKASELKDGTSSIASEFKDAVQNKASEVSGAIHNKSVEFQDTIYDKTNKAKDAIANKTAEATNAFENKSSELKSAVTTKTNEATGAFHDTTTAVLNKKDEIGKAFTGKKDAAQNEMDRIRHEAELTTDEIKKKAEDTLNAAADKKAELQTNVATKLDDLQRASNDEFYNIQRSSKEAFDHAQDSTLSAFDKVESSAKDKLSDGKDTWEDLQSSTRDTFADMRDDALSLGSSAQDTLHSFQSSAGNTFDSLDDSAKEIFGNVQSSTESHANDLIGEARNVQSNTESQAKELFGETKDFFGNVQSNSEAKSKELYGEARNVQSNTESKAKELFGDTKDYFGNVQSNAEAKSKELYGEARNVQSNTESQAKELYGDTKDFFGNVQSNTEAKSKELFGDAKESFEGFQVSADNKLEEVRGGLDEAGARLGEFSEGVKGGAVETERAMVDAVGNEADKFTSSLNNLGSSVFGSSGKGLMKDSTSKLLESEKAQSSPHKKNSGIPKLKKKNRK